jgi:hypothetical protein
MSMSPMTRTIFEPLPIPMTATVQPPHTPSTQEIVLQAGLATSSRHVSTLPSS